MIKHCLPAACCAFALACAVPSANAAFVSYDSRAGFLGALGGAAVTTYDFDTLTAGTIIASGDTVNGATFSYSLAGPGNPSILVDDFFDTTSPANYLGTDDGSGAFVSGDGFTITFDRTMRAVGLYVISADLIMAGDFTVTTGSGQSAGNGALPDVTLTDGDAYFIGLIEDDPGMGFDSITLSSQDFGFLFNVDDIMASPVPVPAAIWLFAGGALSLAGLGRRKSRES